MIPINVLLLTHPQKYLGLKVNYVDNEFFPEVLRKEMEEMKETDFDLYRHIWLGEPVADSENAFIKPSWIEASVDAHLKLDFTGTGSIKTGFDVADEGDDKSAIVTAKGSIVYYAEELDKAKPFVSGNKVIDYCLDNDVAELIWDCIGVGADVLSTVERRLDSLQNSDKFLYEPWNAGSGVVKPDEKYDSKRTNKDFFENAKAQAWWQVRKRFYNTYRALHEGATFAEDEMISLDSKMPMIEKLKAELSRPHVDYSKNDKVYGRAESEDEKNAVYHHQI